MPYFVIQPFSFSVTTTTSTASMLPVDMTWGNVPFFVTSTMYTAGTTVVTYPNFTTPYGLEMDHSTVESWQEQRVQRAHERAHQSQESRYQAHSRAAELLMSILDDEQRQRYEREGTFEVVGSLGHRYRIRPGSMGNVDWMLAGQVAGQLCAHPLMDEGVLPDPDVALSQLLALTTDEAAWLAYANVHSGERPQWEAA